MKILKWLLVGVLLVAQPAFSAQTVCIPIYPSGFDPGTTNQSATRVDVAPTTTNQGYTVEEFGPGTGGGGDPANFQGAFFHFAYPVYYTGNSFQPISGLTSAGTDATKRGCYAFFLQAATTDSVYSGLAATFGTVELAMPPGVSGAVFPMISSAVSVRNAATSATCLTTGGISDCAGAMVVGYMARLTDNTNCPLNDLGAERLILLNMCFSVP